MENQTSNFNDQPQQKLSNATAVLVLGILSIVGCCCYGVVGLICAIIAMVLAGKDLALYNANPGLYTLASYKNLKAGRICAIIGLILSILSIIIIIISLMTGNTDRLMHPDQYMHH